MVCNENPPVHLSRPIGKWGASANKKSEAASCTGDVANCPAGKHSHRQPGAKSAIVACTDDAFSFSGTGVSIDTGNNKCISDGPGKYEANKAATITVLMKGSLYISGGFATGSLVEDFLKIKSTKYL